MEATGKIKKTNKTKKYLWIPMVEIILFRKASF
jgi:hypothetical protein